MPKKYGDYYTLEAFAEAYNTISEQITELEIERKRMNQQARDMMGTEGRLDYKGGYFIKYLVERKSYPVELVVKLLGLAVATQFLKVDKAKVDAWVNSRLHDEPENKKWARVMTSLLANQRVDSVSDALRIVKDKK